jgi:hypothetical protein
MDEQLDDMFMEHLDSSESFSGFGESHSKANHSAAASADASNDHQFLEEFKARDEEFLSLMRDYEHLGFKNGMEEARFAAMELSGGKLVKKDDIARMFSHAGGWKVGALEEAELVRAVGSQVEGEGINVARFQEFLLATSVGKNAAEHAFQPKFPIKLKTVMIEGFPAKTSVAYVNSLCSEYGLIENVKRVDSGAKHSKHHLPPSKFAVTFMDEHSASRTVQKLHGFSSRRIAGPLSCRLLIEEQSVLAPLVSSSVPIRDPASGSTNSAGASAVLL